MLKRRSAESSVHNTQLSVKSDMDPERPTMLSPSEIKTEYNSDDETVLQNSQATASWPDRNNSAFICTSPLARDHIHLPDDEANILKMATDERIHLPDDKSAVLNIIDIRPSIIVENAFMTRPSIPASSELTVAEVSSKSHDDDFCDGNDTEMAEGDDCATESEHDKSSTVGLLSHPFLAEDFRGCPEQSSSLSFESVEQHLKKIDSEEKPFHCSFCRKGFTRSFDLNRHIRIHTGEKPYSCDLCQEAFVRKAALGRHMQSHTGQKSHSCSVCLKGFSGSTELKRHMRSHTGEKPFSCEICQKTFSDAGNVARHFKTHTGEKLHKCDVCLKQFIAACDLKRHIKIHTGEKPFTCDVCQKKYSRVFQLTRHQKVHNKKSV